MINPSANKVSLSIVLLQNDTARRAHSIYFASRLLNNCKTRYSFPPKMLLSLRVTCIKFNHYFSSSMFPILMQSNYETLMQTILQLEPFA